MASYEIVCFFAREDLPSKVVKRGLTEEEAKEHCKSPEASSKTAKSAKGRARTVAYGEWFEGFRQT